MRLSELRGKEIVDINDGVKIGVLDECELFFDDANGKIHSILVPNRTAFSHFIGSSRAISIPWDSVQKISNELIIVNSYKYKDGVE